MGKIIAIIMLNNVVIANGNIDTNIYLFELSSVLSQEQNIFALETISLTFLQPII